MQLHRLVTYYKWLSQYTLTTPGSVCQIKFVALFFMGLFLSLLRLFKKKEPVDFYFIIGCDFDKNNLRDVIRRLRGEGYTVKLDLYNQNRDRVRALSFGYVPWNIPCYLARDYSVASYISYFSPKVVVFIDNIDFKSTILRHRYKIKTVNIAHGVRINDWDHSYIDFDYYFVFGQSSVNHMKKNENLFGNTRAVITGSYYVDHIPRVKFEKEKNIKLTILFLSQWLHPRVKEDLNFTRLILLSYAQLNPLIKIIIKLHPLEVGGKWKQVTAMQNVEVLKDSVSLEKAIEMSDISVSSWSNAMVVATWMGCPIISIDRTSYARNNLDLDEYFPLVSNVEDFSKAVDMINNNQKRYENKCRVFSKYHFSDIDSGSPKIAEYLSKIIQGNDRIPYAEISENISW